MTSVRVSTGSKPFMTMQPNKLTKAVLRTRTKKLQKLWTKRTNAAVAQALRYAVEVGYANLIARIPTTEQYENYRNSLHVAKVNTRGGYGYAIMARQTQARLRGLDVPKTLLYVQYPTRRMRRSPKEIDILVQNNPWTVETLPFVPDKKFATVIQKLAPVREVVRATRARKANARIWKQALIRCGVRLAHAKPDLIRNLRVVPDIVLDALSLEFGTGTVRRHSHWRPSIKYVVDSIQEFVDRPEVARALLDPTFKGWKRWPFPTVFTITEVDAKRFEPFEKRLGILA